MFGHLHPLQWSAALGTATNEMLPWKPLCGRTRPSFGNPKTNSTHDPRPYAANQRREDRSRRYSHLRFTNHCGANLVFASQNLTRSKHICPSLRTTRLFAETISTTCAKFQSGYCRVTSASLLRWAKIADIPSRVEQLQDLMDRINAQPFWLRR